MAFPEGTAMMRIPDDDGSARWLPIFRAAPLVLMLVAACGPRIYAQPGAVPPLEPLPAPPAGETLELPDLWAPADPQEVVGPAWYNPFSWFGPEIDGSFQLGINAADGNASAFSLRTGFALSRETERTHWDLDFNYGKNRANGVETQHNALLWSNWDLKLASPRWSWFTKLGLEYDEFKNFDVRLMATSGLGYLLVDGPSSQLRGRVGSGTSREVGGVDNAWKPEASFGADFNHKLGSRQTLSAVVDYFPVWDDFDDYRVIADIGWQLVLDQASNLSLKVGLINRYDSTPNGLLPNDTDYALLLLWKL